MNDLKILIADDHPLFRVAIRQALQDALAPKEVIEAHSASTLASAIEAISDTGLVLLDLAIPGARGFSSLVWLRSERPDIPVIVISSSELPRIVRRAQQFGAAGFIPKSSPVETIGTAVRAVMSGDVWFPPLTVEHSENDARLIAGLSRLTPQQFRVLMLMAEGLLNKQIATVLGLAENTVKIHVTAILSKLNCRSRTQAAILVRSLNLEEDAKLPDLRSPP
ncbi:MAG: response regulator transcription factor [Xanthomonadaceae bacterium]|jgi:DNA-binding NarL/FixJ family response regulator|nr:response regulator transcription factor [Xanthomonadaceae bacterium]